jgi:hypothetical protein
VLGNGNIDTNVPHALEDMAQQGCGENCQRDHVVAEESKLFSVAIVDRYFLNLIRFSNSNFFFKIQILSLVYLLQVFQRPN